MRRRLEKLTNYSLLPNNNLTNNGRKLDKIIRNLLIYKSKSRPHGIVGQSARSATCGSRPYGTVGYMLQSAT
uniref:Uncharacterized protein n=1 Tax=Romanomermis culicivorax TaxID=13658 RepID=A0A915I8I6_ROMCU